MSDTHSSSIVCTRYVVKDNSLYEPIGVTTEALPSGFYQPSYDSYNDKYTFKKKDIIMPKLYILPNEIQKSIIDDINNFWQNEERYRKFGNVYKRNILLYSTPGNGKTSLIHIICNQLLEKTNGVVICIEDVEDLDAYRGCMQRFRAIEPSRKVVTVIEDFETLIKDDYHSTKLLQLLDGISQLDNVVTIATTNHPEMLEKRFSCRPSRFNLMIEYKKPTADTRRAYIENKLSDSGYDISSQDMKDTISRYVDKTDGFTFDFVKELIQGIYIENLDEETVFERLNSLIDKDGNIKVTEEDSKKTKVQGLGIRNYSKSHRIIPYSSTKENSDVESY